MNRVIQIRATNAMGKTTIIRQYVEKYNLKEQLIIVNNNKIYITTNNDKSIVILGKYGDKWGGCDNFKDKQQVFNTIFYVIKRYRPKTIIFEGLLYGKTFLFAYNLNNYLKKYNYKYTGVTLNSDFNFALNRLKTRNEGKDINIEAFYNTWHSVLASYKKLKEKNIDVRLVDITNINYDEMVEILERVIDYE